MQYLSLTLQECMQTLPQKMARNKIKAYTVDATKQEQQLALKRLKYRVSQDDQGSAFYK